jgi:hypothetical protein
MFDRTISNGIKELQSDDPLLSNRHRPAGGGRKSADESKKILEAIGGIVELTER